MNILTQYDINRSEMEKKLQTTIQCMTKKNNEIRKSNYLFIKKQKKSI
jgi:hypothetical protein